MNLKEVNMLSLLSARKALPEESFKSYLSYLGIQMKDSEFDDLKELVKVLDPTTSSISIFDHFFIGYVIGQIGKEFDLLRLGNNYSINIEIKSQYNAESIKKQLIKNRYYLGHLPLEIFCFTFVSSEQSFFLLNENGEIDKISTSYLKSKLVEQEVKIVKSLDELFDPSQYLVSPFNSTEAFVQGKYFLTDHQDSIKSSILKIQPLNGPVFIGIDGGAGTGKSLLGYDIAKHFIQTGKKVIVFHCGSLNLGHRKLNSDHSWFLFSISQLWRFSFNGIDLIFIDEAQRLSNHQWRQIEEKTKMKKISLIFCFDLQQYLATWERKSDIFTFLTNADEVKKFQLSGNIRSNKAIASFVVNFFDLSKENTTQSYENVSFDFFASEVFAQKYLQDLKSKGWKIVKYTPSKYQPSPFARISLTDTESAHQVIGQEYDKVVAVIDEHFSYNSGNKLEFSGPDFYYDPLGMLYQIMTRAKKKLKLIIIDNQEVLARCVRILKKNSK